MEFIQLFLTIARSFDGKKIHIFYNSVFWNCIFSDRNEGAKFLEKLYNSISFAKSTAAGSNVKAAVLCQLGIADLKLEIRDSGTGRCTAMNEVKTILEEAGKNLDGVERILPEVHGEYYRISSKYLRELDNHNAYYREALRYLRCIDVEKSKFSKQVSLF